MQGKNKKHSIFEKWLLIGVFSLIVCPIATQHAPIATLPNYNYTPMLDLMEQCQVIYHQYYNNFNYFMSKKDHYLRVIEQTLPKLGVEKERFSRYISHVRRQHHGFLTIKQRKKLDVHYSFLRSTITKLNKIMNGCISSGKDLSQSDAMPASLQALLSLKDFFADFA